MVALVVVGLCVVYAMYVGAEENKGCVQLGSGGTFF